MRLTLERLKEARIPFLALKGVVLASTSYETMSLRPMDDLDLLVKPADAPKTLDLLEGFGWRIWFGQLRPRVSADFAVRPACTLENRANPEVQVDLHWRLFWARFSREAETALWERAVEFDVGGEKCLAPSTADMLLHVCAHGARWNPMPPLRWVADAAFLIRTGTVDWTHLCVQTERLGLALPLADTLNYLRSIMRVAVPEEVIRNLVRSPPTAIERLLYDSGLRPPTKLGLSAVMRVHRHIAWHELARFHGAIGYWRYFVAVRRGRGLMELLSWMRHRLASSASS